MTAPGHSRRSRPDDIRASDAAVCCRSLPTAFSITSAAASEVRLGPALANALTSARQSSIASAGGLAIWAAVPGTSSTAADETASRRWMSLPSPQPGCGPGPCAEPASARLRPEGPTAARTSCTQPLSPAEPLPAFRVPCQPLSWPVPGFSGQRKDVPHPAGPHRATSHEAGPADAVRCGSWRRRSVSPASPGWRCGNCSPRHLPAQARRSWHLAPSGRGAVVAWRGVIEVTRGDPAGRADPGGVTGPDTTRSLSREKREESLSSSRPRLWSAPAGN